MADAAQGTNDSFSRAYVYLNVYEQSISPQNNTSTVYWNAQVQDNNPSFGGYSYSEGSWSVTVNGVSRASASGQSYDFGSGVIGSPYFPRSEAGTFVVTHNSNGTAGPISGSASFNAGFGSASVNVSAPLTTFSGPTAPTAAPVLSRPSNYTSINISSFVVGSNGSLAPTRYDYDFNTDNSTWGNNITSMGAGVSQSATKTGLTATTGYYFRTRGVSNSSNSWGAGAWSSSRFIAGIPSAPQSISATRSGRNVTVTITGSSTNGGATITAYTVQRSDDSGATWTDAQNIDSGSYTYVNLTAGKTYVFRAYATNSTGDSAVATSSSVFVSAYGKRVDATNAFVTINTGQRYDANGGGAGVPGWVSLSTSKKYADSAIATVSGTGSVVTYTTSSAHSFLQGDVVSISGVSPIAYNLANVTITGVPTSTSFTVNNAATGTYVNGGTVVGWANFQ